MLSPVRVLHRGLIMLIRRETGLSVLVDILEVLEKILIMPAMWGPTWNMRLQLSSGMPATQLARHTF